MFELSEGPITNAVIKVIGVGGGGGNAVEHMIAQNIPGVDFICANTDIQALKRLSTPILLQLGEELTKGLGAGADPEIGRLAAEENRNKIRELLTNTDMVFITAGMGGGTGTGAAPIVAEVARELGVLTVAVVTKPFSFEGKKRIAIAEEGIGNLAKSVDSLIVVPNNKLLAVLGKNTSLLNAFREVNNVLLGAVQGIAELITRPGLINVDFADVRTVMAEMGMAMMGTAESSGEYRAREAAEAAISSPLLDDIDLANAGGVLVNITAGTSMTIGEFEEIGDVIKSFTSENATVVVGTVIDPEMHDNLRVTIVVTGLTKNGGLNRLVPPAASRAKPTAETQKIEASFDFRILEKPTILRNQEAAQSAPPAAPVNPIQQATIEIEEEEEISSTFPPQPASPFDGSIDLIDIPAFLRRRKESE
ncbi:MAG: cell division protein FtsZ [Gammaproteobacteria bacterium]